MKRDGGLPSMFDVGDRFAKAKIGMTRELHFEAAFPMKRSTPMPSRPAVGDVIQRRD